MDHLLGLAWRIGKALVLGAVMYFSLRALDFSVAASFSFALVPAVLGSLNIMTYLAFGLTGLLFIVASGSILLKDSNLKPGFDEAISFVQSLFADKKPAPAASRAAADVYLLCKGKVSAMKAGGTEASENQEIVAHIKGATIGFSGNRFLAGENIPICSPSADQPYFDSESCEDPSRKGKKGKFGTYNKITGALELSDPMPEGKAAAVEGRFTCARTEPLIR